MKSDTQSSARKSPFAATGSAAAEPIDATIDEQVTELEVMEPSQLEAIQRAEIDVQISTAKRYPRSMELFRKRASGLACLDEETAESCLYRRPVGKKRNEKSGKMEVEFAEGMSVRMAEIVGASYGNLRVYATLVEQTPRFVRARGMAIDLEANFASASEVVESTVTRDGEPFSERMRVVVAKAALAKARRDATFQVVPRAIAKPVEIEVRKLLLGDGSAQSTEKRRARVVGWIATLAIDPKRVYAAVNAEGPADLDIDRLDKLTGIRTAIKDGDASVEESFPVIIGAPKFSAPPAADAGAGEKREPAGPGRAGAEGAPAGAAEAKPESPAPASAPPSPPAPAPAANPPPPPPAAFDREGAMTRVENYLLDGNISLKTLYKNVAEMDGAPEFDRNKGLYKQSDAFLGAALAYIVANPAKTKK